MTVVSLQAEEEAQSCPPLRSHRQLATSFTLQNLAPDALKRSMREVTKRYTAFYFRFSPSDSDLTSAFCQLCRSAERHLALHILHHDRIGALHQLRCHIPLCALACLCTFSCFLSSDQLLLSTLIGLLHTYSALSARAWSESLHLTIVVHLHSLVKPALSLSSLHHLQQEQKNLSHNLSCILPTSQ